jgi:probable selenium-dependent hydroxylase accessory protein YqeC
MRPAGISDVLDLAAGGVASFAGAGGKTTVLLSLAHEQVLLGRRVIVTTTTKIWPPPGMPAFVAEDEDPLLDTTLRSARYVRLAAAARRIGPDGKLHGVSCEIPCRLIEQGGADIVLVEADGAAGRPAKAHKDGEPVVPACSFALVVIAGADAIGKPITQEHVHRPEIFSRVVGSDFGTPIEPRHLALSMAASAAFAPAGARTIFLLNKVERRLDKQADQVAEELRRLVPTAPFLRVSRSAE